MLVEHHGVETKFFGIDRFVEILVVQARADFAVEKAIRSTEEAAASDDFFLGGLAIRTLGEIH